MPSVGSKRKVTGLKPGAEMDEVAVPAIVASSNEKENITKLIIEACKS
eukprot:CAMPEP_0119033700 /NCGR_PEP_ID=MMETSP1177-20130426/756_1 /TAXON_ID=2985 /ORGANISM="Ochromonas sp, Strain CCMP1899" /LENGTH=47 /DNA_ID= /DNA_START= /DNA_END= /DNA_ORIENTATION=